MAWELTNGPIPAGLFVLHHCDNRPCCNPAHLFLGTQTDNMRDASRKGRLIQQRDPRIAEIFRRSGHRFDSEQRGEANLNAKLSDDDVRLIRSSKLPETALAKQLGVGRSEIGRIRRRELWAHVKD